MFIVGSLSPGVTGLFQDYRMLRFITKKVCLDKGRNRSIISDVIHIHLILHIRAAKYLKVRLATYKKVILSQVAMPDGKRVS